MVPIPRAGVSLIDAGAPADPEVIRGWNNFMGPYLGVTHDAGAYELGLGLPWAGPRSFTNLLAYGLPKGWRVGQITELANYASLGAPSSVSSNAFRLLLVRDVNPQAFFLVTFEELQGEARWSRLDEIVAGQAGDMELVKRVSFRDGLDARIVRRGSNAQFLGARVDDEGVTHVLAGVAVDGLDDPSAEQGLTIQDDLFTAFRALQYAWYLQDVSNPISLTFVIPPAPGVVPVGSDAAPSTENAVSPGKLHGDVTLVNAGIIWDVEGDENLNATATVDFRRLGTTAWRPALNLNRIKYNDSVFTNTTRNRLAGSIFWLSPGTTYELRVALADPDGGSETCTTTFTTRQVMKAPQGGRVIELNPSNDLNALSPRPGDTYLFHAGAYTTLMIDASGTPERPLLFRAYGDGEVKFNGVSMRGSHVWLDGLVIETLDTAHYGIVTHALPITEEPTRNVAMTRNTIKNAAYSVWSSGTNDVSILDCTVIAAWSNEPNGPFSFTSYAYAAFGFDKSKNLRGHVIAYNDITNTFDGVKTGDGNTDVHGNRIHHIADNPLEFDYAWDNNRGWENVMWDVGPNGNNSLQPMKGGPWYHFRNQSTGSKYDGFKLRSFGALYVVANSVVSAPRSVQHGHWFFEKGSAFANNYWKALTQTSQLNSIGDGSATPDPAVVLVWGYNRYEADPCRIWNWAGGTLQGLQALGMETGTKLLNDPDGTAGSNCSGGGGGGGGGNQAPTAKNQQVIVVKNKPTPIQMTGSVASGAKMTFALGQGPFNGTPTDFNASTGKVTYTPNPDYLGDDSFEFTVTDGSIVSLKATVTLKVIVPKKISGILLHLKLDETSGLTTADASGHGNPGTLNGTPQWTLGKVGGALEFDGVDDHVTLGNAGLLNFKSTESFSIAFWIKKADLMPYSEILTKIDGSGKGYGIGTEFTGGFERLRPYLISPGAGQIDVQSSKDAELTGRWKHVVLTYNGLSQSSGLNVYLDGSAHPMVTNSNNLNGDIDNPGPFQIGARNGSNYPFKGLLDDVLVLDHILDEDEILTLASGLPIGTVTYGDANQDGAFGLADLVKVARWLVGLDPMPPSDSPAFIASDVADNIPDKQLNLRDLNSFAQKLVGKITCFPVEDCA